VGQTTSKIRSGASAARSKRRSASTAAHTEAQNALYVAPWAVLVLIGILGTILHVMWSGSSWEILADIGMAIATVCVAYAGYLNTRARTSLALGHTMATILLTGGWLILCSATGLLHLEHVSWAWWRMPMPSHPTLDLYVLGGISLCVAWNMRQGVHAKEAKDRALIGEVMDEWGEAGHPGVRGKLKYKNEYFDEGTLVIPRGDTLSSLQSSVKAIESAHDWPAGSLTLLPKGRSVSSRLVTARRMKRDPLADAVHWTGVETKPKLTLLNSIKEGMRADGVVSELYVATTTGTKHWLVQGMSGSGKTSGQAPILLECANRGAVQIVLDTVSAIQMFGPLAPALQWLIPDNGLANAVLKRLADVVLTARMEQLARERKLVWDPSSSLKLLRVHIEEAWDLLDADELMAIAVTARKAGVQLVISLQRASHDQLNTTVREQLGTRLCYGLGGQFGTMILDDEVLDAGANPVQWKDEQPGMHYLTRGGLSISEKATPTRSFFDGGKVKFADVAQQVAPRIVEMDEVTANAFGQLWVQRIAPVDLVAAAHAPLAARAGLLVPASVANVPSPVSTNGSSPAAAHPARQMASVGAAGGAALRVVSAMLDDEEDVDPDDVVGASDEPDDDVEEELTVCISQDGRVVTFSGDGLPDEHLIYDPLPDGDNDLDFEDPDLPISDRPADRPSLKFGKQTQIPREVLTSAMQAKFDEIIASHQPLVTGPDFVDIVTEGGYGRTLVYKYFDAWVAEGRLHKLGDGSGWLVVRTP
jgi:hypothetical protein